MFKVNNKDTKTTPRAGKWELFRIISLMVLSTIWNEFPNRINY